MFHRYTRLFITLITFLYACYAYGAATPLDRVVAVVNEKVITQNQLNAVLADLQREPQAPGQPPLSAAELRTKALDMLINQSLQLQLAAHDKLTISDADVNKAIAQIAQQNNLNVAQLKEALAKQHISYTQFYKHLHDQLLIHQLQQRIFAGRVTVSDQEVQAYLKNPPAQLTTNTQYRLDDLLLPLDQAAPAATVTTAQATAEQLLTQARKGISFVQLAKSTVGAQQAELGWRNANELPTVFAAQVLTMKPGSIIGPIRAPNGFHLLKLLDVKGQTQTLTAAQAKNLIFQQKIKSQVDDWLQELRKSSYVRIM